MGRYLYDDALNQTYVEQADLERPLIFIEAAPDSYNLADGNHRVKKAQKMGIETLPAYFLTAEQAVRYLDSEDSCARYLDYWNGKAFACNQMQHYDDGCWFTLFRLRDKIFIGESDAHEASVRCVAPFAVELGRIETALPFFEGWMNKDKDVVSAARKNVKNARYIMALIRIFSY